MSRVTNPAVISSLKMALANYSYRVYFYSIRYGLLGCQIKKGSDMDTRQAFAAALRLARRRRGLSQEALGEVSGRTYISALERGLKSPTLQKVDALATAIDIHPVTLVALAYLVGERERGGKEEVTKRLLDQVRAQIEAIWGAET